ncbi:MAG: acetate/propionate family kinase [Candidatus Euphemobacter frigidus]|nr:acetate/propionate family kinase [Candidatus Euphemobacter frigidus]
MHFLIFNCGSSSLTSKVFQVGQSDEIREVLSAKAHRVGVTGSTPGYIEYRFGGKRERDSRPPESHRQAAARIAGFIKKHGIDIDYLGHRFVHGGSYFRDTIWVDRYSSKKLRKCLSLAPIHNPLGLSVIKESERSLPGIPQYVTFDNAFHADMPPRAYTYALPRNIIQKFGFRRFGFHGLSYLYTTQKVSRCLRVPPEKLNIIACHLGTGGASVAAIKQGRSVDTSMGYSPLSGLIMSTRCGDIDPMVTIYLMAVYGYDLDQLEEILNKQSGLLGISGYSSDIRDVIDNLNGSVRDQAQLAFKMYIHRIKKYVGSYAIVLGGMDVLAFTDDIGVRNPAVREKICQGMEWLGVKLDRKFNTRVDPNDVSLISAKNSRVKILTVPPEEELVICWEGLKLLGDRNNASL